MTKLETVIVRGNLTIVVSQGADVFCFYPRRTVGPADSVMWTWDKFEDDWSVLVQILRAASLVTEPTKLRFDELRGRLNNAPSAAEVLTAISDAKRRRASQEAKTKAVEERLK